MRSYIDSDPTSHKERHVLRMGMGQGAENLIYYPAPQKLLPATDAGIVHTTVIIIFTVTVKQAQYSIAYPLMKYIVEFVVMFY